MKFFKSKNADLAEYFKPDVAMEPGDVVVFGGTYEITLTNTTHDPRIAGVYSTAPAYLMNVPDNDGTYIPLALVGRVPCKVIGPVNKGDLLVASATKGYAQKLDTVSWVPGCVLGKSMEDAPAGAAVIEIAVGRYS